MFILVLIIYRFTIFFFLIMFVLNGLRELRSKLKKMQEPQTSSLQLSKYQI